MNLKERLIPYFNHSDSSQQGSNRHETNKFQLIETRKKLEQDGYKFHPRVNQRIIPRITELDLKEFLIKNNISENLHQGFKTVVTGLCEYIKGNAIEDPHENTERRMKYRDGYKGAPNEYALKTILETDQLRPNSIVKVITGIELISMQIALTHPELSQNLQNKAASWHTRNVTDDSNYDILNPDQRLEIVRELEEDTIYCLNNLFQESAATETIFIT